MLLSSSYELTKSYLINIKFCIENGMQQIAVTLSHTIDGQFLSF